MLRSLKIYSYRLHPLVCIAILAIFDPHLIFCFVSDPDGL